jgi:polyisoprenoid-binding protein YceI
MKKISLIVVSFVSAIVLNAQSTNWNYDASHSKIRFAVDHMVISEVEGKFDTYSGSVKADKADFSDAVLDLSIDVKSIDTDNEKRDEHLVAPDFFDAW